jgi:hypothetical protein
LASSGVEGISEYDKIYRWSQLELYNYQL